MYTLLLLLLMWLHPIEPLLIAAPIVVTVEPEVVKYSEDYNISFKLTRLVINKASKYNVPLEIAFSLVYTESRFYIRAKGEAGEIGLGQIMPSTARSMDASVTIEQLYDPETNLELSFRYLGGLLEMFKQQAVQRAVASYNRGPRYGHNARASNVAQLSYVTQVLRLDK